MAIFGAQLVITLIVASIIQKLHSHFSFAKWILCSTGLRRYLHPTDDQLKSLANVPKEKGKFTRDKQNKSFHVPRNLDICLESSKITPLDVVHLRYFTEYQWLIDFSIYAGIVYIISEVYQFNFPLHNETNLSMVWCLLVIFFSLKLLGSLTVLYFQNDESMGERSMCIVACFFYMLVAMIVLIIDENVLETGLETAYRSFNESASEFLIQQGLSSTGPASALVLKFFIAFGCGLLGSFFTFPGLRMARMHWDSLRYCADNKMLQLLLNISLILPLVMVILWIRPISRDYLTVRIFSGMDKPLMTSESFETMRIFIVILMVILRMSLMPVYLQAYLNLAQDRVEDLKKEAGRITNVNLQRTVSSIFFYLCVVTLQFAAPLIFCLYLTFMYKNLGGLSWTGFLSKNVTINTYDVAEGMCDAAGTGESINSVIEESILDNNYNELNIIEPAHYLQESWHSLKRVFSTTVWRGFLGFATWWSYFTLFATSSIGMLYQSYFNKT
ncbi:transmembrane protein 161B [Condylostylus longicornis]|uniref:transmembrane protein 161B n=1 Tax=Condylostylus longicornis TaxID=2530218 RepID=UPI00244E4AB1|nr:transmembrane protein 161B [Condylostylus longicornis]